MMRLVTFIVVTFFLGSFAAQSKYVSSLDHISSLQPDSTKVFALNKIAEELRERDGNLALKYAEQAYVLAKELRYPMGIGYTLENISSIYYQKGILTYALEISTKALAYNDSLNNGVVVARLLNTISAINVEQNHHALAFENLKRAYQVSKEISHFSGMAKSRNNLAVAFLSLGKLDSALMSVKEGIELSKKSNDKRILAEGIQLAGDIFLKAGDARKAGDNYRLCLLEATNEKDILLKISTLFRFGKLYNERKEPALAIPYLSESMELAKDFNLQNQLEVAYQMLAESYSVLGNTTKAFEHQRMFIEIHDENYKKHSHEQLALMQAKFDAELKQAQIELLLKNTQIRQREVESQKIWFYFSIGCLALLLMLAFVLFDGYRRGRRINFDLKCRNAEIQEQARQLNNLNITKDKLFSIIGHDLRSPVASLKGLMSIVAAGNLSPEEFGVIVGKLKGRLDSVYDDLDNLLQWAQSQLKGLQAIPETIDLRLLVSSKIELFRDIARHKKVKLRNEVGAGNFARADRNHISLVLRNLLANAIKFTSDGGLIIVQCDEKNDNQFEISVSDSGIGIDQEDQRKLFNAQTHFTKRGTREEKGLGIGLLLTKEFVESNGGSIWVTSELGKGSTFTFTVKREIPVSVLEPDYA